MAYTWQSQSVNDINWAREITTEGYDNIQKQNLFADSSQENPLFSGELQLWLYKKWEKCKNTAEIRDLEVMNDYKRKIPLMCRGGGF